MLTVASALLGDLHPGRLTLEGWGWVGCIALISTVVAVSLFFAGLSRVGPSSAAILSTVEPLVTVLLAFLVFSETLTPVQVLGGVLVLGGVVVLNARVSAVRGRAKAAVAGAERHHHRQGRRHLG